MGRECATELTVTIIKHLTFRPRPRLSTATRLSVALPCKSQDSHAEC